MINPILVRYAPFLMGRIMPNVLRSLDTWFDEGENDESVGYGLHGYAHLTNPESSIDYGKRYGERFEVNDIIEMRLDCNKWTLSYKINDKDFGKAFDIEPNEYRAAITLTDGLGCLFELISYQKIY